MVKFLYYLIWTVLCFYPIYLYDAKEYKMCILVWILIVYFLIEKIKTNIEENKNK